MSAAPRIDDNRTCGADEVTSTPPNNPVRPIFIGFIYMDAATAGT